MAGTFNQHKIIIFTGINDSPTSPTSTVAGNGSHLIAKLNDLCDDLQTNVKQVALSGSYGDLDSKPELSTIATTGDYADVQNKPNIPDKFTIQVNGYDYEFYLANKLVIQGDTVKFSMIQGNIIVTIGDYTPPIGGGGGY
jgi:hypothetical protein